MTEEQRRKAAVRDVPPPRPVPADPQGSAGSVPAEEGPLGRAARAVADAVSGLLGRGPSDASAPQADAPSAAGLRDVASALAGALAAWRMRRGPDRAGSGAPAGDGAGDGPGWSPGAFLGDLLSAAAPRLPIRDRARLLEAYPGATDGEIAEALVSRAARLTSGIGAAAGGLSAIQWFAAPSLVALPLEVAVETVLVAAVEVVLVGELHELHGRPASGDGRARAAAYLSSWTAQRAIEGVSSPGWASFLGTAGLTALRRRMTRRVARNLSSLAPLFIGAALGSRGNRKATENLGRRLLADLRR